MYKVRRASRATRSGVSFNSSPLFPLLQVRLRRIKPPRTTTGDEDRDEHPGDNSNEPRPDALGEAAREGIQVLRARRVAQGFFGVAALGRDDLLERALFFSSREVPALAARAEVVAVLDGVDALTTDVAAAGEAHIALFFLCLFQTMAPRRRRLASASA